MGAHSGAGSQAEWSLPCVRVAAWCRDAVKAMLDSNISGAPVTNAQGKLIGIISESDLIWKVTNCACP